MTALTLKGLTKSYTGAGQTAIRGLNLTIESGSLTALLGPSGSGKTTTMKLIAGLLQPDAGDILLDGREVTKLPPERRGVAMVFQNPLLFPHLTVAGNVGFGLRMRGLLPSEIAANVDAMLVRVRLDGLGARRPLALSGGQQQRAALARALVLQPDLLLLDEPLSNLDPALREEMRGLIRSLQRETGITTLVVTHDQAEAVALADRIALLLNGRIAQHRPPEDFYQRPATEAVARFFGGVNFLAGEVRDGRFLSRLGPLLLPDGYGDQTAILTIRPEAVVLGAMGENTLDATITGCQFLGTQTRVLLSAKDLQIEALVRPAEAATLTLGQTLPITLPRQSLWLLPPKPGA
jgi:ABC-type Fe3+/spermidine/putrescine transport system ATPase subunit